VEAVLGSVNLHFGLAKFRWKTKMEANKKSLFEEQQLRGESKDHAIEEEAWEEAKQHPFQAQRHFLKRKGEIKKN
jgi:hypothetical protein